EGADLESEVFDEPKGNSIDTSEGTFLKQGVFNVSKANSSNSEYESWGDSDDDNDDDDQQCDDGRTEFNNPRTSDDEEEDKFVHTPNDYVPTDDENVDDEEYDQLVDEGKDDGEVTHADNVDAEHENVNLEIVFDQVKDITRAIIKASPAT
nr:hypothetical protein [Tanacetum cinerariifolium]